MRLPQPSRRGELGVNMTPMIDVVFQLIIFFLVSSHLAKQEAQMKLPLPEAASGEQPADDDAGRVTLNLLADGAVSWNGRRLSPSEVGERLRQRGQQQGAPPEIRLRCDRDCPYRLVEPVLSACAQAGARQVSFAVFPTPAK